jgi:hypothetical protein
MRHAVCICAFDRAGNVPVRDRLPRARRVLPGQPTDAVDVPYSAFGSQFTLGDEAWPTGLVGFNREWHVTETSERRQTQLNSRDQESRSAQFAPWPDKGNR